MPVQARRGPYMKKILIVLLLVACGFLFAARARAFDTFYIASSSYEFGFGALYHFENLNDSGPMGYNIDTGYSGASASFPAGIFNNAIHVDSGWYEAASSSIHSWNLTRHNASTFGWFKIHEYNVDNWPILWGLASGSLTPHSWLQYTKTGSSECPEHKLAYDWGGGQTNSTPCGSTTLSLNTPHFVVINVNYSSSTDPSLPEYMYFNIYLDNQLEISFERPYDTAGCWGTTGTCYNMSSASTGDLIVDDVNFINRELTLSEISGIWNSGVGKEITTTESPPSASSTIAITFPLMNGYWYGVNIATSSAQYGLIPWAVLSGSTASNTIYGVRIKTSIFDHVITQSQTSTLNATGYLEWQGAENNVSSVIWDNNNYQELLNSYGATSLTLYSQAYLFAPDMQTLLAVSPEIHFVYVGALYHATSTIPTQPSFWVQDCSTYAGYEMFVNGEAFVCYMTAAAKGVGSLLVNPPSFITDDFQATLNGFNYVFPVNILSVISGNIIVPTSTSATITWHSNIGGDIVIVQPNSLENLVGSSTKRLIFEGIGDVVWIFMGLGAFLLAIAF